VDIPQYSADPVIVEGNDVPPDGTFDWLERPGDIRLRYALWPVPASQTERGTVVIVPGRIEFIEKYFETISELQERGFAITILDLRGQGLSSRELSNRLKGHITDFQSYVDDLHALVSDVVLPNMPQPLTLLGHSMGGTISLCYLHDHSDVIERAVLSAPMTGIKLPLMTPFITSWLASLAVRLGVRTLVPITTQWVPLKATFKKNLVTRDEARFDRFLTLLRTEPLLALGPPTFGWINAAYRAMANFSQPSYLTQIKTPILIAGAGNDRLIDSATHHVLAPMLPMAQLEEIANCEHEILMERDEMRRAFWAHFDQFVNAPA